MAGNTGKGNRRRGCQKLRKRVIEVDSIVLDVLKEFEYANGRFQPFHSKNEAAGVIREEYLEAEYELFHGSNSKAKAELIQLAAMAIKAIQLLEKSSD